MLQDLKEEYLDAPTELSSGSRAQQLLSQAQKEKQEYEEDYLMRLPVTKAEKHRQRKLTTLGMSFYRKLVETLLILIILSWQVLLVMKFLARLAANRHCVAMALAKNANWPKHVARERNVAERSESSINNAKQIRLLISYNGFDYSFPLL